MDLYVEKNSVDLFGDNGEEMTPYHRLLYVDDFTQILDNIRDYKIPTATGQPFSCASVGKFEEGMDNPFGGKCNQLLNY